MFTIGVVFSVHLVCKEELNLMQKYQTPSQGAVEKVKIPLLPYNVDKRSVNNC